MRLERAANGLLYGGKGRGPIGKPVRALAGVVGVFLVVFGIPAFFAGETDSVLFGVVVEAIGLFLVMLSLKAGPAPPGSRGIDRKAHV